MNGPGWIRTNDQWIMSPLANNHKPIKNKDFASDIPVVDKKTDSKNQNTTQKQGQIDTSELSSELAEIVTVWPELPEYIKAAIKALVQTNKAEKE